MLCNAMGLGEGLGGVLISADQYYKGVQVQCDWCYEREDGREGGEIYRKNIM